MPLSHNFEETHPLLPHGEAN